MDKKNQKKRPKIDTFPKLLVTLIVLHGMLCVTASYVFAFFDKVPNESLSITIVGEIIAPVLSYIIANVFSNIFEKNKLSFSTPLSTYEQEVGMNKESEMSDIPDETI